MDKIKKQIQLNVALIIFSCLVIFIARSIALNKIASFKECMGADIVFTMITSLVTTSSWRIVENIKGSLLFNIIIFVFLTLFSIIYGAAIVTSDNEAVSTFIIIGMGVFVIIYIIENIMIIIHFRNHQIISADYGYKKEN